MVVAVKFANSVTQIENTQSKSKNKCFWENATENRAKAAKALVQTVKVAGIHETGWEKTMDQGSQNSLKDEWLVGLLSIPVILSFCGEWGRTIVAEGFAALETMPDWYQYTLGVIVAASFGVRSATKFFRK